MKAATVFRVSGIERLTGGQVTRRDLRPHDWREIWPELQAPMVDDQQLRTTQQCRVPPGWPHPIGRPRIDHAAIQTQE